MKTNNRGDATGDEMVSNANNQTMEVKEMEHLITVGIMVLLAATLTSGMAARGVKIPVFASSNVASTKKGSRQGTPRSIRDAISVANRMIRSVKKWDLGVANTQTTDDEDVNFTNLIREMRISGADPLAQLAMLKGMLKVMLDMKARHDSGNDPAPLSATRADVKVITRLGVFINAMVEAYNVATEPQEPGDGVTDDVDGEQAH